MSFNSFLLLYTILTIRLAQAALSICPDTTDAAFDYVVVGAGAGGGPLAARLAESGFSVLVVDAGHDVVNVNDTVPLFFARALDDPQLELNYTLNEYPPGFKFQRNDAWYPRARALGGSTTHNALINIMSATRSDFANLVNITNNSSWSYDNMWEYFKDIEHNLYIPPLDPDHGYTGWLKTNVNPLLDALDPMFLDLQITEILASLVASGAPILDLNSRVASNAVGTSLGSFTADEVHNRSSVHDRLAQVQESSPQQLQFALDTLATQILLCNDSSGGLPRAYGVEIARGAALAVASNFNGKGQLETETVIAKREVIVAAGAFQSPQLLMLSGIGDTDQLSQFAIETVVHLPGVGKNLQDHDEIATIWLLKQNTTLLKGCTFLSNPDEDPCLAFWTESGHQNVYSFGPSFATVITKSSPELDEPDILTYWAPGYFPGFFRGIAQEIAVYKNALTAVNLKARTSSRGTVTLTGSHPQDQLNIQKQHFQADGGLADVAALREGIKTVRSLAQGSLGISIHIEEEVFPGPQANTDDEIDAHVYENIFGHHACCTNPIGSDEDENAVLDGDFKVRGVSNLRVVDMSSWPNVPGFFVTTATYMISEKAADVIMAAAR